MQAHPLLRSYLSQAVGIVLFVMAITLQCGLLIGYGYCSFGVALGDSLCSLSFLVLSGYCLWYVRQVLPIPQVQVALALFVLLLWSVSGLLGEALIEEVSWSSYLPTLPFRLIYGALLWIILTQWYALQQEREESIEERVAPPTQQPVTPPAPLQAPAEVELIDRVSVKDGARIHIIDLEEILYLQAFVLFSTIRYFSLSSNKFQNLSISSDTFSNVTVFLSSHSLGYSCT